MCELCMRGEEVERACQETKSWLKLRGFVNWRSRQCSKKLALVKAHKSVVSSQHQSCKAQQENLKPGEVLVVLDFQENLQVGSGPIEVGNDCYSKNQVSCLGFAVYIGGNTTAHYFDYISFSLMMDCLWERVWTKSFLKFNKFLLWVFVKLFCFSQFLANGFLFQFLTFGFVFQFLTCGFLQTFLLDGLWASLSLLRSDEWPSLWTSTEARNWNNWSQFFCWASWQISSGLTLFSRFSCCESMDCDRAPYKHWWPQKSDYFVLWAVQNFSDSQNNSTPTTHSK